MSILHYSIAHGWTAGEERNGVGLGAMERMNWNVAPARGATTPIG